MKNLKRFGAPTLYLSTLLYMGYVDVRNWGAEYFNVLADRRGDNNHYASRSEQTQLAKELEKERGRTVLVEFPGFLHQADNNRFLEMARRYQITVSKLSVNGPRVSPSIKPIVADPSYIVDERGKSLLDDEVNYPISFLEVRCADIQPPIEKEVSSAHLVYRVSTKQYWTRGNVIFRAADDPKAAPVDEKMRNVYFCTHLYAPGTFW